MRPHAPALPILLLTAALATGCGSDGGDPEPQRTSTTPAARTTVVVEDPLERTAERERRKIVDIIERRYLNAKNYEGLRAAPARECVTDAVASMRDTDVHQLMADFRASRRRVARTTYPIISACITMEGTGRGGRSWVRAWAIGEATEAARAHGDGAAAVRCIRRRLGTRYTIEDQELGQAYAHPDERIHDAMQAKLVRIVRPCLRR